MVIFIPRCLMAVISQAFGVGMIWAGLPEPTTMCGNNTMFIIVALIVVSYTAILFFTKKLHKERSQICIHLNGKCNHNKSENKTLTDGYILWLAILDAIVLGWLMILTDGIKSPFSTLLFTIPAVTYLLSLPLGKTLSVLGVMLPILIVSYFYYFPLAVTKGAYFWVSLLCLFVIGLQIANDHFSREKPKHVQ